MTNSWKPNGFYKLTMYLMKNSEKINNLGFDLEESYDVYYLPSDFKKNGGTQLSRDLSIKYDIYRQNYCGCVFAAKEQKIDFKEIMKKMKEDKL